MDLYLWKPVGGSMIYKMKEFQRRVRVHFICKYVICILGNSDRCIVHQKVFLYSATLLDILQLLFWGLLY